MLRHGTQPARNRLCKRLREVVELMDKKDLRNKDAWKQKAQERSGTMPDDIKIYLLNKLFRLSAPEIGKMFDRLETSIARTLKRIADRMMPGEINLLTVTEEEAAEAKSRLDKSIERNRKRYL